MSFIGLAFSYIFAECWWAPTINHLNSVLSEENRGLGMGIWIAFCGIIGNLGSILTALIEQKASISIGISIFIVVCLSYLSSAAVFIGANLLKS
jgi:hypothetical protein